MRIYHFELKDNIMPEQKKPCKKCRTIKDMSKFSRDKRMPDGHFSSCKECVNKTRIENDKKRNQELLARNLVPHIMGSSTIKQANDRGVWNIPSERLFKFNREMFV
jgi:hypothetical protein